MKYHATFECTKGPDQGKKWRHSFHGSQSVVIGRLRGCHILLTDPKVSQSHCLIQIQGKALCLIDMGSTHGTRVNSETTIGAVSLKDGDRISLGKSRLVLHLEGVEPEPLFSDPVDTEAESDPPEKLLDQDYAFTRQQAAVPIPMPEAVKSPPEAPTALRLPEAPTVLQLPGAVPSPSSADLPHNLAQPVSPSLAPNQQQGFWQPLLPGETANTGAAFCFPRCLLCHQQQDNIYVCRVTGWDYCQNCRELLEFIIEQLALTHDRKSHTTCEIHRRREPLPQGEEAIAKLLQSPQIDIPWQVTAYGVTIPICQHGKQMLLYVSRLDDSQMALSLARLESLESECLSLHPHLYPICSVQMWQRRLLTLLPYYPGAFLPLAQQPLSPSPAFAMVMTLARAVEYINEKNGYFGEITPAHIYQEVTGHLYLVGHSEINRRRGYRDTPASGIAGIFSDGVYRS